MPAPTTRINMSMSHYLHKRLKYQAFMRDTTMTQIMERAVEGLVEYLEADDSVISREPQDGRHTVSLSTSVTREQAELFNQVLTQRGETSHDVLERAIAAYLASAPRIR